MKLVVLFVLFVISNHVNASCPKCCGKKSTPLSSSRQRLNVLYQGDTCDSCGRTLPFEVQSLNSRYEKPISSYQYDIREPKLKNDEPETDSFDFQKQIIQSVSSARPQSHGYDVYVVKENEYYVPEQEYDLHIESVQPPSEKRLGTLFSRIDRVVLPKEGCQNFEDDLRESDLSEIRNAVRPAPRRLSNTCNCGCGKPAHECDGNRQKRTILPDSDVLIIRGMSKLFASLSNKKAEPTPITYTTGTMGNNLFF